MYSYEERLRAVRLYVKYGKRLQAIIHELGYPTKNSLKAWCKEFEEGGELQKEYVRSIPKYSADEKNVAIEHYVNHGRCSAFTRKTLGYPSREKLSEWVDERYPGTRKRVVGKACKPAASMASKGAADAACQQRVGCGYRDWARATRDRSFILTVVATIDGRVGYLGLLKRS